ncbi:hypothetical protein [Pararhizobium gei]|uniref:hypothetical protein n=1 Tax=Pararhizobium gei TaxID=1395951 RepID=UPI0023D99362|nr:hypothetical protein [Rhizobium gei]
MLTWPAELPLPNREGWQRGLEDPRQDRTSTAGPVLPRLIHGVIIRNVSLVMDIDRAQLAVFDRFLEDDTAIGSLPFLMPDPITDGWPALTSSGQPILMPDGRPLLMSSRKRCYFGKPLPTDVPIGNRFRVSYRLVVLR